MKDIRVVFMGTPSFAVPILKSLIDNYNVVLVVCQPDRKMNRKGKIEYPDTKKLALEYGIPVFQPEKLKNDYSDILESCPDIVITCAYGQIVPDIVLNYPKYGCINVHGSLLPELRGGAPIHWAIIRGYKKTGITIMYMNSKMDAGDIISQASIDIDDDMILGDLYSKMSILGRDLLLETLPSIINGTCNRVVQDESKVTYGFNVSKDEMKIDFSNSAIDIRNLVRGLNPIPGAYCFLGDLRVKVYDVLVLDEDSISDNYGEIVRITKDGIICNTGDRLIEILDIAVSGKKRCKVKDYLNGVSRDSLIGKVFM